MSDVPNTMTAEIALDRSVDAEELTVHIALDGRLPVLETVSKSYLFLFHHGRELLQLVWPLVVVEFVGLWGYFLHRDISPITALTPIQAGYLVAALVAAIPMIARVQRFALNPAATSSWLDFHFGKDDLLVIGALFSHLVPITLFFFIIAIVMVVLTDIELGIISAQVFVLAGIAAIAMSMLAARLILIYPATLARKTISIASAWRLSRDHFTRLLLVWAFATVPFRLAYRLSDIASQHIWHNLPDAVFLKTLIYLGVVILPTTLSVLGQIIVTFVALTITYNCLVAAER